jgi:MFS family permease
VSVEDPVLTPTKDPSRDPAHHNTPADGAAPEDLIRTSGSDFPQRRSPLLALRYRDFRLYWGGGFVSQVGSQMRLVAVGVQMWDLTHNYAAVGLLGLVKLVPLLILSLFGGVIADAVDRRRLLMLTQTVMALTSVVLAVATMSGWASPLLIYGVSAAGAAALAFDNPARSAMIPNLVPREYLPNALSLNIIVWQIATIIGPVVAGVFLPLRSTGFSIVYWIDAVSFSAVVLALLLMKTRFQRAETRDVSLGAALTGLRFLRRAPIIMSTMTLDFFATFFGAAMTLLPAFAEQVLHLDRSLWGILYAAPAAGAVVAGIIMSWLGNVRGQGKLVLLSVAGYGVATIVFGASSSFWLTALALAGTGAADTVSMVMRQTIRQMSTPDELRGRMTSVNMLFYMGGPQLGEMEAGLAATVLGLAPSIILGGAGVLAAAALISRFVPSLSRYDREGS